MVRLQTNISSNMETKIIDLRSDTLTQPSRAMKEAMMNAPLGDDVFGDDPTVKVLQEKVSALLGKEAALYVPSGTMGNLICTMIHCWGRGSEVLVGDQTHMHLMEQGGMAQLGGIHHRTLANLPDGTFSLEELRDKVRGDDVHFPITKLVCIENSHAFAGGKVLPLTWLKELSEVCSELGLPIHLDGARLLNSVVASGVSAKELASCAASVSLCLSKGLGAPIGSVIAGTKEFIERVKRLRKVLGAGMRQVGILAAAGIYALDHAEETLNNDHKNTYKVAKALSGLNSNIAHVDLSRVHTNILLVECDISKISLQDFCKRVAEVPDDEAAQVGSSIILRILPFTKTTVRLAFYNGISEQDAQLIIKKMSYVIRNL